MVNETVKVMRKFSDHQSKQSIPEYIYKDERPDVINIFAIQLLNLQEEYTNFRHKLCSFACTVLV